MYVCVCVRLQVEEGREGGREEGREDDIKCTVNDIDTLSTI